MDLTPGPCSSVAKICLVSTGYFYLNKEICTAQYADTMSYKLVLSFPLLTNSQPSQLTFSFLKMEEISSISLVLLRI